MLIMQAVKGSGTEIRIRSGINQLLFRKRKQNLN